jgi:hypothetical protein
MKSRGSILSNVKDWIFNDDASGYQSRLLILVDKKIMHKHGMN